MGSVAVLALYRRFRRRRRNLIHFFFLFSYSKKCPWPFKSFRTRSRLSHRTKTTRCRRRRRRRGSGECKFTILRVIKITYVRRMCDTARPKSREIYFFCRAHTGRATCSDRLDRVWQTLVAVATHQTSVCSERRLRQARWFSRPRRRLWTAVNVRNRWKCESSNNRVALSADALNTPKTVAHRSVVRTTNLFRRRLKANLEFIWRERERELNYMYVCFELRVERRKKNR